MKGTSWKKVQSFQASWPLWETPQRYYHMGLERLCLQTIAYHWCLIQRLHFSRFKVVSSFCSPSFFLFLMMVGGGAQTAVHQNHLAWVAIAAWFFYTTHPADLIKQDFWTGSMQLTLTDPPSTLIYTPKPLSGPWHLTLLFPSLCCLPGMRLVHMNGERTR